ncbi:MAG: PAS domain-containing sensor histidine kinase [Parcubacteria group bacterium]|nr:PAS domain-containing sensor histidine kinase [Parcubacteria group bacterium]
MKSIKENTFLIIAAIFAFVVINIALFYVYPGNFTNIAYITFLVIPLFVAIVLVFTRFSVLFTSRISEQEDEKKLLRERQKEIVENMVEGLIVHNKLGKILSVNSTAERFLGISASEILYKTKAEIKNKPSLFNALFESFGSVSEKEHSFKDKYGKELTFKIINVELSKARGEKLKIIRDISREKHLNKMKSEYLTIMSHKFLTPLNGIKWTAPSLLDEAVKDVDKERFVKNIIKSTDTLIELTSRLLRVTEMEEGSFTYKSESIDLEKIIENAVKDRRDDVAKRNITMTFNKTITLIPKVVADADRIKVVVDNFIDNAIKYTKNKGKIDVTLEVEGKNIKYSVKDNGIGIAAKAQADIFSKFFRDDRAIAMHTEGSGLGLFITKNIIEEHGGKVGFISTENKGSTFFFTLPIKK